MISNQRSVIKIIIGSVPDKPLEARKCAERPLQDWQQVRCISLSACFDSTKCLKSYPSIGSGAFLTLMVKTIWCVARKDSYVRFKDSYGARELFDSHATPAATQVAAPTGPVAWWPHLIVLVSIEFGHWCNRRIEKTTEVKNSTGLPESFLSLPHIFRGFFQITHNFTAHNKIYEKMPWATFLKAFLCHNFLQFFVVSDFFFKI